MTSKDEPMTLSLVDDIRSVESDGWNRLARRADYSPFLEHEFLAAAESSGCASPESGWYPRHFVLKKGGRIVGAAPAYIKTHSMGEFIFDQGLAQAAAEMGHDYYPKLVGTLPFTPSPGYRIMADPDFDEKAIVTAVMEGMRSYRDHAGLSSHSLLFVEPEWESLLDVTADSSTSTSGFLRWAHQYFLWENDGYRSFDDYLSRFSKNQRRNIRRERTSVRDSGIRIETLKGNDLNDLIMDRMYDFYESTNRNFGPWAAFFLNRTWFRDIARLWNDRIVIFGAWAGGRADPLAMSFLVKKGRHLVGRYWGASEFVKNLHFELCYYAPIEFAVNEGCLTFDPGMGSPHKARRGFRSREFGSYHAFKSPEVAALFESVLPMANNAERAAIGELDQSIPWR